MIGRTGHLDRNGSGFAALDNKSLQRGNRCSRVKAIGNDLQTCLHVSPRYVDANVAAVIAFEVAHVGVLGQ